MEIKKNPNVDITKLRGILMLVGMIVSLSSVYALINYKQYDKTASAMDEYVYEEEEVEVEQTVQEEEPPPPPEAPPHGTEPTDATPPMRTSSQWSAMEINWR